jgi:acetyl-CoA carboxylase biotin carboxyl carrier protein
MISEGWMRRRRPRLQSRSVDVKAELTGNLWKILVREGQTVAAEETLMILESMKMEIPVTAPRGGTVTRIAVREGETVQEGQLLARLD